MNNSLAIIPGPLFFLLVLQGVGGCMHSDPSSQYGPKRLAINLLKVD